MACVFSFRGRGRSMRPCYAPNVAQESSWINVGEPMVKPSLLLAHSQRCEILKIWGEMRTRSGRTLFLRGEIPTILLARNAIRRETHLMVPNLPKVCAAIALFGLGLLSTAQAVNFD